MLTYVARIVVAVVALFVFSLLYIAPGDPAAVIAGDQATPGRASAATLPRMHRMGGSTGPRRAPFQRYSRGLAGRSFWRIVPVSCS
jgi:peptide/nickel transport system permease protein